MSRPSKLTPLQVESIKASTKTLKELALEFGVNIMTVWKAKNGKGAYANVVPTELPMASPVLNAHGEPIGFDVTNYEEEQ
jgi:homoserine dehydrogenase